MSKQVYLSPSALNVFNDCPRCFWLDKNKRMKQPRGIFPSLPSGMDKVLKSRYDVYKSARYTYCSSDGWEPNAREWRQCVDAQAAKGSPVIELYRTEFSDGSGGGNYSKRTRPSASYIARTCGAVLVEAGR